MTTRSLPTAGHREYDSLESYAGPTQSGTSTHTIRIGTVPIDLRYDDRGHDTTVVFFHAAITKAVKRYPVFSGATFSADVPANRLFVSDPSLYVDSRLKLAWYAGNEKQPTLQDDLSTIIAKTVPPAHRLIFFGASGGGFASLFYATRFPGSVAIPVNPQTRIGEYNPILVSRYLDYAWGGRGLDEIPVCSDVLDLYRKPVPNSVVYVQNTGDTEHVDKHCRPFMDVLPAHNHVESVFVDAGTGHVPPARADLSRILLDAVGAG